MLEAVCKDILKDLNAHKHNTEDIFPLFVEERLNKSLIIYYKNLVENTSALKCRTDSARVMKKLLKED